MEERYNPYTDPKFTQVPAKSGNSFETASLILAIAAMLSSTMIWFAYIFGALAILFAILSKADRNKMHVKARTATVIAVLAMLVSTVLTIQAVSMILEEYGSFESYLIEYSQMLGIDLEL